MAEPIVLGPGEGESIELAGNTIVLKAEATQTGGAIGVVEYTAAPGFGGPPPHVHDQLHDMYFVLDGTLTVRVGDDTVEARPGSFVLIAPRTVHTFSNPGAEPARFLNMHTPGGFERYFKDVADALGAGPPNPVVMGEIAARYDFRVVS
jgi:mannose-6-phosphate isomerase-like protein (cupin superfamily)